MTDEAAEQVIGKAVADASAPISGAVVAISRLLIAKEIITREEIKAALDNLKRPGFDDTAETVFQHLRGQILRDL